MKRVKIFLVLTILFSLYSAQCKKDDPFAEIKSSVDGKWKLEFIKGGVISNYFMSYHNNNIIWQFYSGNRILQNYDGIISTDSVIDWKIEPLGPNLASAYVMSFYDKRAYPYIYIIDKISTDSLVMHDRGSDPQSYHFSKSN